jgi:DHA1 family multidrug resistance protein-like MFS transporter
MRKKISLIIIIIGILVEVTWVAGVVCGPVFMKLLKLTNTQLGIILGSLNVGLFAFSPIAGNISERFGASKVLFYGILGMVLGVYLVTLGFNYTFLVAGMIVTGIANAFIINANMTLLSELFPQMIRRIISLYSAIYFTACALLSPVIGRWLSFSLLKGWTTLVFRTPFAILLLFFIYFGITAEKNIILPLMKIKEKSIRDNPVITNASSKIMSLKWIWVPLMSFFHGLMYIVMVSWLSPMAKVKFGSNEFKGSLFVGVAILGMALGRFILAFFEFPWEDRKVLAFSTILGSILFFAGLFVPNYFLAIMFIGFGSLIASPSFPCISSLGGRMFQDARAKVYGYMYATYAIAGIVGNLFAGMLADKGVSLSWVLTISAFSALIIGVLSLLWEFLERKENKVKIMA